MDDVEHSRLLKFLIDRMDDPINSNVPGEQIIRGGDDVDYDQVITVTQQETTTTRGNVTAKKITVTEDISGKTKNGIHSESKQCERDVKSVVGDKNDTHQTQHEEKKSKSKIPMLRKAVRQLAQMEEKKKMEEAIPVQRRKSSIPRLKETKFTAKPEKENTDPKTLVSPRTEEEFDKIFQEIKQNSDRNSNAFIKDPAKLEMKFEEIIHDYDEHKVEPINVETLKSRIPMLKRKSEHDIEATKRTSSRLHKKRTSIQNPHHYSKLILKGKNRTQSETDVNDASTDMVTQEAKRKDKSSPDTETDPDISLALSEMDAVISNSEIIVESEVGNVQLISGDVMADDAENRILNKSQSIDSTNKQIQTNVVRRSLSQNDNLSSSVFVQKIVENQILTTDEQGNASTSTETTEIKASTSESKSYIVETIDIVAPYEKDTFNNVKQDMVCEETSMLIRQNQEETNLSVEPKSLEIELSYTTDFNSIDEPVKQEDLYHPTEITEIESTDLINPGDTNQIDNTKNDIDIVITELSHDIAETINEENGTLDLPSNTDKLDFMNKYSVNQDDVEEEYSQVNTECLTIRGHPDALFNRPDTPIEDFLPIMRGHKDTSQNLNLAESSARQNYKDIDHENHEEKTYIESKEQRSEEQRSEEQISKEQISKEQISKEQKSEEQRSEEQGSEEQISKEQISVEQISKEQISKEKIGELLSHAPEEDIIILKGKVNRVISRLDSRDFSDYKNKQETVDEIPPKSVLSRIVLFEQKGAEINRKITRKQSHIDDLPKIVDEVLKKPKAEDNPFIWTHANDGFKHEPRIEIKRDLSYAEVDLGDAVKGRVRNMIVRMVSLERVDLERKAIDGREKPKIGSVSEKIALFEKKVTIPKKIKSNTPKHKEAPELNMSDEELNERIEELRGAKKYGRYTDLKYVELNDGCLMPAVGIGTALLNKRLTKSIICAAIELGYRTIDTAYIYGNEKEIGEAINEKIADGTVKREELFIISKLWSTFHRRDLVNKACKMSLKALGLEYFDLYLIHSPMSFKEGDDPIPKIANVIQYSESDYLDAWFGLETLIIKGLVKRGGVSNFNSAQIDRILDKGKIKPVINQIECHPYMTQYRMDEFCQSRDVKLSCYGVLGSKGTPLEYKSGLSPAIDDPLVLTMAAGLQITPAQLLISYQLQLDHGVVVKASTGGHLWSNLLSQNIKLDSAHISALNALNRNKRNFTFKGMGDTHRNYPFRIPF